MTAQAFEVAAYYFPNYHVDARNVQTHGPGWSEWELVKRAVPRYEGHDQPKAPAWGYTDEADPKAMAQKIDAAADHGLTAFIFELGKFVASAGSVMEARRWLDEFRRRTQAAGFADLHLNAVVWGCPVLPGESTPADPVKLVKGLGFDSTTSYVWVHHGFPAWDRVTVDYNAHRDLYLRYWADWSRQCPLPYYPNVSTGWDSSPRICPSDMWSTKWHYPCTPIVTGNTPAAFREALAMARRRIEETGAPRRITINSWNEWTEGSYLEPDTRNGMRYLEAIRDAFGPA